MTRMLGWGLLAALVAGAALSTSSAMAADKVNVLIIDGQNNHDWKATTPVIKKILLDTDRFNVDVLTSPPQKAPKEAWDNFKPDFSKYKVVFSNYNGESWPDEVNKALEKYMQDGGGLVILHAANNSFGGWAEFSKMCGLCWQGNNFGDRITVDDDGKMVRTPKGQGPGAGHGANWPYEVQVRDKDHPVTKGMPAKWMHASDELYHGQRGPAENMHILCTAFSKSDKGGTGANEPMVFTVAYGKGRVFVDMLGHDAKSCGDPGQVALVSRGTEWAATGEVTVPLPKDLVESKAEAKPEEKK